jgi:hypothetical protein
MFESLSVKLSLNNRNFMKTLVKSKTMIALAVAIAASAGCATDAYEQPIPPPAASADALPAGIAPGSELAQVFKLVRAGVDLNVINNFIANATGSFNLDADKIIALNDAGVPPSVLDRMLEHDRQLAAAISAPPTAAPVAVTTVTTAAPAAPVTVNYFYDTLSPYGSWVEVSGYGRCWRPTTVNYDNGWRPYCDRGHWVYTDCGWYWDSDYAWGATFHYGRWFRDAHHGWCWWPETTWAPSWVVWRSGGDDCGWAPLPPLCEYHPDRGFLYRGNSIAVGFDFGFDENYFVFVGYNRFFDRDVRRHCEEPQRVTQIFRNTTIVNNYNYGGTQINSRVVVNNGIPVESVRARAHQPAQAVQTVAVNSLPNAARHGWRGPASSEQPIGGGAANATMRLPKDSGATVQNHPGRNNGAQNQNVQTTQATDYRGQSSHASRLEQQRSQSQSRIVTPSVSTAAPTATPLQVAHPQVIHPVTPAQTGAVLNNVPATRTETQPGHQRHSFGNDYINTTPPARSELPVSSPQIQRPVSSGMVLPTASGHMEQRVITQQTENRYGETRSHAEPPVQNVERPSAQHSAPAPAPATKSAPAASSDSQNSDNNDKTPWGRHH